MSEIFDFNTAAGSNNAAPPNGFPENMNYAEVNDAARELMAAIARWREATSGELTTTGTGDAYVLTTTQTLTAYAQGQVFGFFVDRTSTATLTLNVNTLGASSVKDAAGNALGANAFVAGGYYMVVRGASDFRLVGQLSTATFATLAGDNVFTGSAEFDSTVAFDGAVDFDSTATFDSTVDFNSSISIDGQATFSATPIFEAAATITDDTDSAAVGPTLDIVRDSATPAADDGLGAIAFKGEDSADNSDTYARLSSQIVDPATGAEEGALLLDIVKAGTLTNTVKLTSSQLDLINNQLTQANIKDYSVESSAPAIASNVLTLDLETGNDFDVAWSSNITTLTISNWSASGTLCKLTLRLAMDGTARTIAWPAAIKWPSGEEPDTPSTNEDLMVTLWSRDGGTTIYGASIGQAFA